MSGFSKPMKKFLASQFRQPTGRFGSIVMGPFMNRINRHIIDGTLELLDLSPQQHVLEIGFGGGIALSLLSKPLSQGMIAGADISADLLRQAERRFRREIAAGLIQLRLGDACQLLFPAATFDRVFTINTIYFWPDTAKGFDEIRRVLKDGGLAAISLRSKEKMQTHAITEHGFRLFSPHEVADRMRQAGFRDVRVDHRDQDRWYDQVIVVGTR
jgi:ubiquinone/menaquinone biosynthesis C-methylase UbiE